MIIKEVVIIVKLILKNPGKLMGLIVMAGFNQSQYAHHIKMSKSYFNAILRGRHRASPQSARKIAQGIGKTIPDLFLIKMRTNVRKEGD